MIHTNFYRKALVRKPIRSLLLLLLLIAITGAFSSHAAEYLLVMQQTDYVEEFYKPIGKLVPADWSVEPGQALVAECDYVELEDIRRSCPGTLQGIQNANVDGVGKDELISGYASDIVVTGELKNKRLVEEEGGSYYEMVFEVQNVEAGYDDYVQSGSTIYVRELPGVEDVTDKTAIYYPQQQDEQFLKEYEELEEGKTYLLRAYYYEFNGVNGSCAARNGHAGKNFVLDTLLPEDGSARFCEVKDGTGVDDAYAQIEGLSSYVELLKHNQCAMEFVGTKDMSRMPVCQESEKRYYLTDGRWLNQEDDIEGRRVCVVHDFFAKYRGFKVGDKICVNLEDREFPFLTDWKQHENDTYTTEEFEIVGIYDDKQTVNDFITFYSQMIYVPDSCIPREFQLDNMLTLGGENFYSFVLEKPEDKQRFLEEYKEQMDALNIQIQFVENNADNFAVTAQGLKRSTVYSTLLFGVLLCMVILFVSSLYLMQRQREFVIARVLGVSGKKAAAGAVRAFSWIAVPGIILGSILGWQHTMRQAEAILMPLALPGGTEHEVSLSVSWLIGIIVAIFFTVIIVMLIGTRRLVKQQVLVLMQGRHVKRTITAEQKTAEPSLQQEIGVQRSDMTAAIKMGNQPKLAESRREAVRARLRYIGKHQIRAVKTTMIVVCLGIGTSLLFGWMCEVIQKNTAEIERIYRTTIIEGEIVKASSGMTSDGTGGGVIPPEAVLKMQETGLIRDSYLEETTQIQKAYAMSPYPNQVRRSETTLKEVKMLGICDWDGFMENTGADIAVQFLAGYSPASFMIDRESGDETRLEVILPEAILQSQGAELGDAFVIQKGKISMSAAIVGSYQGTLGNGMENALLAHTMTLHDLADNDYYNLIAQFTFDPEKNRELLKREEELMQMVEKYKEPVPLRLLIWDEELHQAVEPIERTLQLFNILYPVALTVFFVLGAGFQFLILQQRGNETAVMRALGNKAGTIRWMLWMEQMWLCLLGLVMGTICAAAMSWQVTGKVWIGMGVYLTGNVIGILLGSFAVTKRHPLGLLQEKE